MQLTEYSEALAYDIAFSMAGAENLDSPIEELGSLTIELSHKLRAMAIIVLLTQGRSDGFFHNLLRSGHLRQRYLERLTAAGIVDDHHQASGRYGALLDSLAAGDFTLARRIVEASPSHWQAGHEYEDDFCYAQLLSHLVLGDASRLDSVNLRQRFRDYIDGDLDGRLELCAALIDRDQDRFDEAMAIRLQERIDEIELASKRQLEEPEVVANRRVFVEGLAILRLAERAGLQAEENYAMCPSLARLPMREAFPGAGSSTT